jgi:PRTRC genetic system protein A
MFPIVEAGPPLATASLPAFVVARDGLYLRKRSLLGLSQTKVGRVAHLPEGKEFVDYALPKVPADLMARAAGFFRAVYRLHRTEAAVLLVWHTGSFDLAVPEQKVSSVSVTFDVSDVDLPAGSRLVGTMHSHGGFTAYASTTDEDDEAELDGLHVVVGDFDRRRVGYSAAIVVDGVRFHRKTGQLIERPRRLVEPPEDWLGKVKLAPPPRRPKTTPSISEYLARGWKPSDEISKPSRRELEDALDRAAKMATALGYRLSHWLVPVNPPLRPEGSDDD